MNNFNFDKIINRSTADNISHSASRSGNGKYSFGIVCSEQNGKRVSLTTSLASKLNIDDEMFITSYASKGFIVISPKKLNDKSVMYTVKGADKKIAYNSSLVHYLIDTFNLNFEGHVSRSFDNIEFNNDPENPMAMVIFFTPDNTEEDEVNADEEKILN